jgi:hypothetical protein
LAIRLGLPERHLESMLQALTRHGILKGTPGSRGRYELVREEHRIRNPLCQLSFAAIIATLAIAWYVWRL